jgi:hypothetical protein
MGDLKGTSCDAVEWANENHSEFIRKGGEWVTFVFVAMAVHRSYRKTVVVK